ncbi:MAG: transglutaminase domain-containing protein [Bacteroidota bacterium]
MNLLKNFAAGVAFLLPALVFSQNELNEGWDLFRKNDMDGAIEKFQAATKNPATKAEAHVVLAMIQKEYYDPKNSFKNITEFIKASDNPEPFMSVLWGEVLFNGYGKQTPERLSLLNSVLSNPKLSAYMKARANYTLGEHYQSIGDFKKAKTYFDKVNSVGTFMVTGTFENISASGYDKVHEPISSPGMDKMFKNKNHAEVGWFEISYPTGHWIDFNKHFFTSGTIIFAQTFCNSDSDRDVVLNIGTSGSLKLWINDVLVFAEETERNNDMDTYRIPAKLFSGKNRILLQIGASEINRSNFMLRITDKSGEAISGLTYSNDHTNYVKKSQAKVSAIPLPQEKFFEDNIKAKPDHLLNYLLLAKAYSNNEKTLESQRVTNEALKISPDCSMLMWQLMLVYLKDENRTALSAAIEKMRKIDPENPLSLEFEYSEANEKEDYPTCNNILAKMEKRFGVNENTIQKKIELLANENKIDELLDLVDMAYSKYPDNYTFVLYKYELEKSYKKNSASAIKVMKNYTKNNYVKGAWENLASTYLSLGTADAFNDAMEILKKLAENEVNGAQDFITLGDIYFQLRDYTTAESYYHKALNIAPYISSFHSKLALCYEQMKGFSDKAEKSYKDAIRYNPKDYESRANLRRLKGEDEVWKIFGEPDVDKLFENTPDQSAYPEDNSVILLDEIQRVIYPGGGSETKYYFAVKLFNVEGVDIWKEYYASVSGNQNLLVEKAEIIKKDGNKIKAEVNYSQIVFTGLEPGDCILVIYKVENYYSGKLSEHFWDKHYFTIYYPYLKSKYSILVPSSQDFKYKVTHSEMLPEITNKEDFKLYSWEKTNQPSVKSERYMSTLNDFGEILHISSFPSWDYISEWYSDLAKTKSKSSYETKELTKEILKGKESAPVEEKVRLIYNYIVNNIRYSSIPFRQSGLIPQKASDVITTKIGDCKDVSTLFVALCREAGIEAQLVLINTRENGREDMALPSIEFNHCIGKVKLNNKDYYVELTSDLVPFSTVSGLLKNSFSLDISDAEGVVNEPKLLNPSTRITNAITRYSEVKFDNTKMMIEKKSHKTGGDAADMRETYKNKGKEQQEKDMTTALSSEYQNMKLMEVKFSDNLNSMSDSVSYSYKYEVNNPFTTISDMNIIKLPLSDVMSPLDFLAVEKRKYPVELWAVFDFDMAREELTIHVPTGKKLMEVPKSVKLKTSFAEYNLLFSFKDNKLSVVREFKVLEDVVAPEKFQELKDFFEKVLTADGTQIGFKKLTP